MNNFVCVCVCDPCTHKDNNNNGLTAKQTACVGKIVHIYQLFKQKKKKAILLKSTTGRENPQILHKNSQDMIFCYLYNWSES